MKIAVIGGGPSGLIAAGSAYGAYVVLFERGEKVGKKIYITGKGRCNFTNICDNKTFLQNVVNNAPFLYSALASFSPYDAVDFMENNGCKTKVERGRRAFPISDKASDITKALSRYAAANNVDVRLNSFVSDIIPRDGGFTVKHANSEEWFDRVIVCTGGKSYPVTGSDGSLYPILKRLGHTVVKPVPSLVALNTKEDLSAAEGLTLKNIQIRADGVKPIFGDMMITETGISGPVVLTLSAYVARYDCPFTVRVDLKPALSADELDSRLLRDFGTQLNKQFKNALDLLLPKSLIPFIIERSGIDGSRQVNSVTKTERRTLVELIKNLELTVTGSEGFDRAVVTSGGVDVKQVNPKTMMSRVVDGLFLAGEVLDVDALTGGYNFHIALATGYVAGINSVGTYE